MKIKILIPYQEYLKLTNTKPAVGDEVHFGQYKTALQDVEQVRGGYCLDIPVSSHYLYAPYDGMYKQVEAEVTPNGSTTPGLTWTYKQQ